ncbi:hypothetical protein BKA67DRAFT_541769 [Truncatella angustata]|uniref:Uncharacterized protein n=1 Tax=Truncatella angustata TaxID=152316 RepID=A0A9P8U8U0_9PEZI|nr:uncharacterized protein BKA67DRAFT_541769 [Truncatella angustata]KAH6645559.1 hypothetical protein BKA67DRAFT_541769 [Truncatella angustata]
MDDIRSGKVWGGWQLVNLKPKLWNTISTNYHLGFTSFGGPPVHFKIYQELFSICQAFSGPGSTKMHFCINQIHDGFLPALLSFFITSLPGALGMYGLPIGVSNIGDTLPGPAYALLSELNASSVGIIAVAAVQLSEKAITDKITRILVLLGVDLVKTPTKRLRVQEPESVELSQPQSAERDDNATTTAASFGTARELNDAVVCVSRENNAQTLPVAENSRPEVESEARVVPSERSLKFTWPFGLSIIVFFLITFIVISSTRKLASHQEIVIEMVTSLRNSLAECSTAS